MGLRQACCWLMFGLYRSDVSSLFLEEQPMTWTKPEFAEVAVTLEVTAYAARR
jgi:coenzyme PQQ precursor peptide PqqA